MRTGVVTNDEGATAIFDKDFIMRIGNIRLIAGIGLLTATLGLSGGIARAQTTPTVIALPAVSVLFLAEYVAEDAHVWDKAGLAVKVLNISGIGSINAVISKSADFSMSSGPSITRAYAHGQKLVALATALNQSGQDVVLRKDIADATHFDPTAPLATRAQILKGRTIAISAIGAIPDLVLRAVAKAGGVTPDQMTITPMQPPEFLAAFARKSIDGFSNTPPFIQQVVLDGTGVIVSDSAKGEPTEFSPISATMLLTRADFCAQQKTVCEKATQGIVAAMGIIRTQPSQTLAIMKTRFPAYDDKVLAAAYEMVKAMTPDSAATTVAALENGDLMNVAAGYMKSDEKLADYKVLIDNSFIK
jgi:ABC-type nitrate/sulfonate/bicarbonate transport system substrate-binding protein